jgi:hypothetical protein
MAQVIEEVAAHVVVTSAEREARLAELRQTWESAQRRADQAFAVQRAFFDAYRAASEADREASAAERHAYAAYAKVAYGHQ